MNFTDSYIALCREHPMETKWEPGDFALVSDHLAGTETIEIFVKAAWWEPYPDLYHTIWIPRLDQLLDLLIAAGVEMPAIYRVSDGRWEAFVGWVIEHQLRTASGETAEEAAYRLLLGVRTPVREP